MKKMAKHLPDAGFYAPVTILIDERPDGVHLPYDRMARLRAPTRVLKLRSWRGNWTQNPVEPSCEFVDL
jgi:hypothetical protein